MDKREEFRDIIIEVFKEGDRSLKVRIPVRVHFSHAQSGWVAFLNRVMRELALEDIEGIYEEVNGTPTTRIASLVDGGLYFARPTEVCAMMRSLVRTEPESHPAWPSVEKGLEAKRELERCRVNFENSSQVLQMLDGMLERNRDKDSALVETVSNQSEEMVWWKMRVKQGFKCRVYKTPECRREEVEDVLVMGTIVTLSLDWGEALEDHPRRGNGKGGKVLRMVEPHDGFVERRPLEDVEVSEEAETRDMPWSKSPRMTAEKRMAIIRSTGSMPDILRATLRRGAYFRGAEGIHNMVEVHRVALRAAATLMRKDPKSRDALMECGGIELFALIVGKFCDDRMVCEYGCWAFSVFAGEGDATPDDFRFQTAAVKAGAMKVVARMVDVHLESASLRRHCLGALTAIVDGNASVAAVLVALNLHVTVAEDSIRRWPNDAELSSLSCWVLLAAVQTRPASPGPSKARKNVLDDPKDSDPDSSRMGGQNDMLTKGRSFSLDLESAAQVANASLVKENRSGVEYCGAEGSAIGTILGKYSVEGEIDQGANSEAPSDDVLCNGRGNPTDLVDPCAGHNEVKHTSPSLKSRASSHPTELQPTGIRRRQSQVRDANRQGAEQATPDSKEEGESVATNVDSIASGEQDVDVFERLLKLAAATKVANYDNENTRKAASALVQALVERLSNNNCASEGPERMTTKDRITQIIREGEAMGAL